MICYRCRFFDDVYRQCLVTDHGATLLLMLGHVPLGNILLAAEAANERSHSGMLPQVDLHVGPGVVLLVAALELTLELVDILMCFLVVPQNPLLSEL